MIKIVYETGGTTTLEVSGKKTTVRIATTITKSETAPIKQTLIEANTHEVRALILALTSLLEEMKEPPDFGRGVLII